MSRTLTFLNNVDGQVFPHSVKYKKDKHEKLLFTVVDK